jgi:propanol-preferring alcohol dehydrogenase
MATIPKQHKAAVYSEPGKLQTKIELVDTPEPGPGEVLVNLYDWISLLSIGICVNLLNSAPTLAFAIVISA